eukprot:4925245-Pleurochrysis_carterae.AAC.1
MGRRSRKGIAAGPRGQLLSRAVCKHSGAAIVMGAHGRGLRPGCELQNGKLSLFESDSASAPYEHCGKLSTAASVASAAEVAESCEPTMACAPASRSLWYARTRGRLDLGSA